MVVAQLEEQSILTLEICSWRPVITSFDLRSSVLNRQQKEKARNGLILSKMNQGGELPILSSFLFTNCATNNCCSLCYFL